MAPKPAAGNSKADSMIALTHDNLGQETVTGICPGRTRGRAYFSARIDARCGFARSHPVLCIFTQCFLENNG